jgi:hypothetical protein
MLFWGFFKNEGYQAEVKGFIFYFYFKREVDTRSGVGPVKPAKLVHS